MLRDEVAPALRRLGLKGSGDRYTVPSDTHWAVIGFQKFRWSDADCVEFTVNLIVATKEEWASAYELRPYIGKKPAANTLTGVGWWDRIGSVMPRRGKGTWTVPSTGSTEHVAGEVVAAIRDYALPAMRARMA